MEIYAYHGAKPEIHPEAWVAPGVTLIGDVHVAAGASIWFGTVIRGDLATITVGRLSNVQDNSVIHADPGRPCTIGEAVTVGHAVILHGCTIEDRVLVGMGSVVMNGSVIRKETILGARALVVEGVEIPGRSLALGSPAKVARPLKEEELAQLQHSAEHYARLAIEHKNAR